MPLEPNFDLKRLLVTQTGENPTLEQRLAHLVTANFVTEFLMVLRTAYHGDLDLALVAFAVEARTRRLLSEVAPRFSQPDMRADLSDFYRDSATTTVYEIAKLTGLDRATVRRKFRKLEQIGLVERLESGRWHLLDFAEQAPSLQMQARARIGELLVMLGGDLGAAAGKPSEQQQPPDGGALPG